MKQTPDNIVHEAYIRYAAVKYPNTEPKYLAKTKYKTNTANGLTRAIKDFLKYSGHQAERISSMGRYIDESRVVSNVLGQKYKIGTGRYIPSTGTKGTADLSSIIARYSVKIEIKIGKDRQSEAQKRYQEDVERAGGIYWIVRTFEDFYEKYLKLVYFIKNADNCNYV